MFRAKMHSFPSNSVSDVGNTSNTLHAEIDYGDIPENMDEQAMRKYLEAESNLVMPNAVKKKDSFEEIYSSERQKLNGDMSHSNRFVMVNPPGPNQQSSTNVLSNRESTVSTITTQTSATEWSTNHHNPNVDRMSTVTFVSNASGAPLNKREHSFAKHSIRPNQMYYHQNSVKMPTIAQSPQKTQGGSALEDQSSEHDADKPFVPPPPGPAFTSGLTKQIAPQKQQIASQSNQQGGVIQSRNPEGKMVVKQLPYSKRTHMMVNVYVEISDEHIEHIIVHFKKTYTVKQFLDLLKNETNNGAFAHNELEIYCADEDGDLDDDFPAPDPNQVIKEINMVHFYIKIRASEEQRQTLRRETIRHIGALSSTATMDSEYGLSEEESDEESDDDSGSTGCKCVVM